MYNHADEWGGAYYSWSGESNIKRCIFMNNTAGTNGGAVMVSGNLNLESSIIVNNSGGRTGGSFYIQQPMYDAITSIHIHDNLITNNTSPKGQEIYIKWDDTKSLYTDFNNNDWGDEDPTDPSVIDPDKVTSRSKVTSTRTSNLLETMNLGLLNKYKGILQDYYPENYFGDDGNESNSPGNNHNPEDSKQSQNNTIYRPDKNHDSDDSRQSENNRNDNINTNNNHNENQIDTNSQYPIDSKTSDDIANPIKTNNTSNPIKSSANVEYKYSKDNVIVGNSTSYGEDSKAYELNETPQSISKQVTSNIIYYVIGLIIVFLLLMIGYKREKRM